MAMYFFFRVYLFQWWRLTDLSHTGCSCTSSWADWWSWCCLEFIRFWSHGRYDISEISSSFSVLWHQKYKAICKTIDTNQLKCDMVFSLTLQRKRLPVKIEKGTGGMSDVDISWIPQETLNVMSKFTHVAEQESSKMPLRPFEARAHEYLVNAIHSLQTKLHPEHLRGNEPTGRLERINKMFRPCWAPTLLKSTFHPKVCV